MTRAAGILWASVLFGLLIAPGASVADTVLSGPVWSDHRGLLLGYAVAVGDINGDGLVDIAAGAPGTDRVSVDEGVLWIYFGKAGETPTRWPNWEYASGVEDGNLGRAVALCDVNADGFDDVISAQLLDSDNSRVLAFYGSPSGFGSTPNWFVDKPGTTFGAALDCAGDVNSDGFEDILVGQPTTSVGSSRGAAWVYSGSASGLESSHDWTYESSDGLEHFGSYVAGVGDVTGDGRDDVVISTAHGGGATNPPGYDSAYLFRSTGGGLQNNYQHRYTVTHRYRSRFGWSVAAGDFNGDSYRDLAIGEQYWTDGQSRIVVYNGSSTGVSTVPDQTLLGPDTVTGPSFSAALSADLDIDIDGDGYDDLAVGEPGFAYGRVHLVQGGSAGLDLPSARVIEASSPTDWLGSDLVLTEDLTGDGTNDLLVGASGDRQLFLYSLCTDAIDLDGDGFGDACDNCPSLSNPTQVNWDADGFGDLCDICPFDYADDVDGDMLCADVDNCDTVANPLQEDIDGDLKGDACDPCTDVDADSFGDPGFSANICPIDNCPAVPNPDQLDEDGDGAGDACDNCLMLSNPDQADGNSDGEGDACDCDDLVLPDGDGDGVCDVLDNCPTVSNVLQRDTDLDGIGNLCDICPQDTVNDPDGDGLCDLFQDNCPGLANPAQWESEELAPQSQWAVSASASSEGLPPNWDSGQATGAPEFPGQCISATTNWAPLLDGDTFEFLSLTYATPVRATEIGIQESSIGQFVTRIDVVNTEGQTRTVWSGNDMTACGSEFAPSIALTPDLISGVVVHTQVPGWEEIDAVRLDGSVMTSDDVGSACDNCPFDVNPSQTDSDLDGAGDACDCAPNTPSDRPAAIVSALTLQRTGASTDLDWPAAAGADRYRVIRGSLDGIAAGSYGACIEGNVTATTYNDATDPLPGQVTIYLIQGESDACGPGSLGFVGSGFERRDPGLGSCP